jgi:uncharacterized phage infection (PIP) family protein YhgE
MDQEQILKRLEWLDDERRKDNLTITTLKERINSLEASSNNIAQQLKEVSGDIARVSTALGKFDLIESSIGQLRVDLTRMIENIDKQRIEHDKEVEKIRRNDTDAITKSIVDLKKGFDPIPDLKKNMQARVEEQYRLSKSLDDITQKFMESKRLDEENRRLVKVIEESQRQDAKRVTDLQTEVMTFRKRLDEQRGKADLNSETLRKIEMRINELQTAEGERKQSQVAFIEKQAIGQIERERTWKEWQARFDEFEKRGSLVETQLQSLDATHRNIKRTQDAFEEISQRFERRINEITEMQRLSEDRFRQDWTGFKADDQKRWTNYTLALEEQQRENVRSGVKLEERLVVLEDLTQELKDILYQANEETMKRLHSLMAMSHEWMDAYEKNFGRTTR